MFALRDGKKNAEIQIKVCCIFMILIGTDGHKIFHSKGKNEMGEEQEGRKWEEIC